MPLLSLKLTNILKSHCYRKQHNTWKILCSIKSEYTSSSKYSYCKHKITNVRTTVVPETAIPRRVLQTTPHVTVTSRSLSSSRYVCSEAERDMLLNVKYQNFFLSKAKLFTQQNRLLKLHYVFMPSEKRLLSTFISLL